MHILSQILNLGTINSLTNVISCQLKDNLFNILDAFNDNFNKNNFINLIFNLQQLMNDTVLNFLVNLIESLDVTFKNSNERKNKYYINKSNVERTIITIFGEIKFKRTLYIDKNTNEYYFYIDDILNIDAYYNYDRITRALLLNDSVFTNPNFASYHSSLISLNLKNYINNNIVIPRSTIYYIKSTTPIRNVEYKEIPVNNKTLYVMVDEKWIHEQDKNNPKIRKCIMAKCFVTFTGIKIKGKRNKLMGKHTFITSSDKPWKEFINEIYKIYNFENINNINLLSDAGSWILSGAYELKLYSNNKLTINTCEFHVKQKIFRSTTDKNLRNTIANIIYELENKKLFIKEMDKLIDSKTKPERKQKITEYKKYILKHWKGIINMKYSLCKSSMEAHIEHCISSDFSSIPKAYGVKNIEIYLKLQEMKLNDINIFKYYLDAFNTNKDYTFNSNKKELNFSLFEKSNSNIPILFSSNNFSQSLYKISHA